MILTRIKRGAIRTSVRMRTVIELNLRQVAQAYLKFSRTAGLIFMAGATALLPLPHPAAKVLAEDLTEPPSTIRAVELTSLIPEALTATHLEESGLMVDSIHLTTTIFAVAPSRATLADEHVQQQAMQAAILQQQQIQQAETARQNAEAQRLALYSQEQQRIAAQAQVVTPAAQSTYSGNSLQAYAHDLVINRFGSEAQWQAFKHIVDSESGWNPNAHNPSGAHGVMQALPAGKMAAYGADYMVNGMTQIRWGLDYVANRYGTPIAAWGFWSAHHWY